MLENLSGLVAILGLWIGLVVGGAVGWLALCLMLESPARLMSIFLKEKPLATAAAAGPTAPAAPPAQAPQPPAAQPS